MYRFDWLVQCPVQRQVWWTVSLGLWRRRDGAGELESLQYGPTATHCEKQRMKKVKKMNKKQEKTQLKLLGGPRRYLMLCVLIQIGVPTKTTSLSNSWTVWPWVVSEQTEHQLLAILDRVEPFFGPVERCDDRPPDAFDCDQPALDHQETMWEDKPAEHDWSFLPAVQST